ncbi:hypothetical protein BDR22DRAFT_865089 [Usnea florida]
MTAARLLGFALLRSIRYGNPYTLLLLSSTNSATRAANPTLATIVLEILVWPRTSTVSCCHSLGDEPRNTRLRIGRAHFFVVEM